MRTRVTLIVIVSAAAFACGNGDGGNPLLSAGAQMSIDPSSGAAGEGNTFNHMAQSFGGDNGVTDPQVVHMEEAVIGSPSDLARMHGAQKVTYSELATVLTGLGVNMQSTTAGLAGAIYAAGASALGAPIFASRVPEMSFPSTSSLAKEFDIFSAAAPEIVAGFATSPRCSGLTLVQNNQFTQEGLSCLMGKPAEQQHLDLANLCVTDATTPALGVEIAIATILAAAHTSE